MRIVALDAGPLGLVSNARGKPEADRCRQWIKALAAPGVRVIVPEIADYEVRRELVRAGASSGIERLDRVKRTLDYVPLTTDAMLLAAEHWARSRRIGRPTGPDHALDGDAILAAQAILAAGPDDEVIVATKNLGHLGQFVDARPWESIA